MTAELSAELIDEASQTLTSVVRLTLPAERWTAVAESVNRMDDSVWAADEQAVRAELKKLRAAVIGTAPRARPGEGNPPTINPLSYRTTDYVTRTPIRRISAILIGSSVVLATLIVLLIFVLALGKHAPERTPGAVAPTTTAVSAPPVLPEAGPAPEATGGGSGALYQASIGAVVVVGLLVFIVMIWRRRRPGGRGEALGDAPDVSRPPLRASDRVPPPSELYTAVDRVVLVLSARRDG